MRTAQKPPFHSLNLAKSNSTVDGENKLVFEGIVAFCISSRNVEAIRACVTADSYYTYAYFYDVITPLVYNLISV